MNIEINVDEKLITPEVKEFINQCVKHIELYAKKNADYGNSFDEGMDKLGSIYAVGRIMDKHNRLIELHKPDKIIQVKDESIEDTLRDLACYSTMVLSYNARKRIKENNNIKFD